MRTRSIIAIALAALLVSLLAGCSTGDVKGPGKEGDVKAFPPAPAGKTPGAPPVSLKGKVAPKGGQASTESLIPPSQRGGN